MNNENILKIYYAMYGALYDSDNIDVMNEYSIRFDTLYKTNSDFVEYVGKLIKARGDLVTSDREAAAAVMVYDVYVKF